MDSCVCLVGEPHKHWPHPAKNCTMIRLSARLPAALSLAEGAANNQPAVNLACWHTISIITWAQPGMHRQTDSKVLLLTNSHGNANDWLRSLSPCDTTIHLSLNSLWGIFRIIPGGINDYFVAVRSHYYCSRPTWAGCAVCFEAFCCITFWFSLFYLNTGSCWTGCNLIEDVS